MQTLPLCPYCGEREAQRTGQRRYRCDNCLNIFDLDVKDSAYAQNDAAYPISAPAYAPNDGNNDGEVDAPGEA